MGWGVVLLLVTIVSLLAFSLSGLTVTNSQLLGRMEQQQVAENLAQSVTRLAIEKILGQPDYGRSDPPAPLTVSFAGQASGAQGLVTFDAVEAARRGLPRSINNLNGASNQDNGSGYPVAPGNARIVAEGRCGSSRKLLECTLNLPSFPYALAAAGRVRCAGGLTVVALDDLADLTRLDSQPPPPFGPASVSSNSRGPCIEVTGPGLISGDVEAVGDVEVASECQVLGQILARRDAISPADRQALCQNVTALPDGPIRKAIRMTGNVTTDGDLSLEGGQLYVLGSLHVRGALRGKGAVTTLGNLTVDRTASVEAGSRFSLVVAGDVDIQGSDSRDSVLQGLIYSGGQLRARRLTVVGALLAGGASLDLQECRIVADTRAFTLSSDKISLSAIFADWGLPSSYQIASVYRRAEDTPPPGLPVQLELQNGKFHATAMTGSVSHPFDLFVDPDNVRDVRAFRQALYNSANDPSRPNLSRSLSIEGINRLETNSRSIGSRQTFGAGGTDFKSVAVPSDGTARGIDLAYQMALLKVREDVEQNAAPGTVLYTLDPSRMLPWRERVRVARWRSL